MHGRVGADRMPLAGRHFRCSRRLFNLRNAVAMRLVVRLRGGMSSLADTLAILTPTPHPRVPVSYAGDMARSAPTLANSGAHPAQAFILSRGVPGATTSGFGRIVATTSSSVSSVTATRLYAGVRESGSAVFGTRTLLSG
jgi:hypothetical protein